MALPGSRRVEHVMGMPIVVDVRDERVDDDAVERVYDVVPPGRRDLQHVQGRTARSAGSRAGARAGARAPRRASGCWPAATSSVARPEATSTRRLAHGGDRPGRPRQGLVGRPRGRHPRRGGRRGLCRSTLAATCACAGVPCRSRAGASASSTRSTARTWRPSSRPNDLALATSGAYARGEHVLDPHTGTPPAGVLSVTISGPDLATADAYATAAFAMGTSGPAWTARLEGYEAMTILADHTVHFTAGFPVARPAGEAGVRRPRRGCRARPRRAAHRPCR